MPDLNHVIDAHTSQMQEWWKDPEYIRERYCQDCGRVFEAEDDDDRYCKRCLLKQYRALDNLMKNIKEMKN